MAERAAKSPQIVLAGMRIGFCVPSEKLELGSIGYCRFSSVAMLCYDVAQLLPVDQKSQMKNCLIPVMGIVSSNGCLHTRGCERIIYYGSLVGSLQTAVGGKKGRLRNLPVAKSILFLSVNAEVRGGKCGCQQATKKLAHSPNRRQLNSLP